jgi:transcription-repair coupling factor (superfamily II helicase)
MPEVSSPLAPPLPPRAGSIAWRHLYGAAKSLAIAQAASNHRGVTLVVAASSAASARIEQDLRFFAPEIECLVFPDWETLPYDQFSPYQDITSTRVRALIGLPACERGVLIAAVPTLMHRIAARDWLCGEHFVLRRGERLDRAAFRARLERAGYRLVSEVVEHGDFAIRGSLVDVFPTGTASPVRIDLFDEEIESLRLFEVETQRSTTRIETLDVLPAREFPLTPEAIQRFRLNWRTRFEGRASQVSIYNDVSEGLAPAGIEYYLPLFFDATSTLFDYLPAESLVITDACAARAAQDYLDEFTERFEQLRFDAARPLLPPADLIMAPQEIETRMLDFAGVRIAEAAQIDCRSPRAGSGQVEGPLVEDAEFASRAPIALPVESRAEDPLALLRRHVASFPGRCLIAADSPGRRETLLELLRRYGLAPAPHPSWRSFLEGADRLGLAVGPLSEGAELIDPPISLIAESQLFGNRAAQARRRRRGVTDPDAIIKNLTELAVGSPVVHEQYGVGRYQGLETLEVGGIVGEFIKLTYADDDKLFVPVSSLFLLSRYAGVDPEHAPLHKLGSGQWEKARRKAEEQIRDVAAELLEIYARREAQSGHRFDFDAQAYASFAQAFPFEETPDQEAAIEAVLSDLKSERPMDRLVCGDAGFGKTEVALRAAFVAVNDGKQVAVLVPTTLLAQQHFQTFTDRFADWPIRVEQLSRFRSGVEARRVLDGIESGGVDIVIGTHKLLSEEVRFKRLGLFIVDEEHRFGVRQKERIKALRASVDILTLTATPIPRTLNLALAGTRELSIIATPPARRIAIKTFVREWSDGLAREAILRELGRGGQVYVVHNKVEDIEATARRIEHIVPQARVQVAHGQMRERALEQVMLDFYHQRCNVLVCTTIVESGIDVPTANTMLVDRADKFGLAQLYQLRGRIGRSHHRAYAYLFVPPRQAMTADAIKRLEAVEALEDLGVGFTLATHDLEIRGAGEILGEEQSGHIQEIGFGLYSDLLRRTVAALKAGRVPALEQGAGTPPEVELHLPALLPADYLPDVHSRLTLYKRIASAPDLDALGALQEEVADRFGPLPPPARNLFRLTEARLRAQKLGIRRIDLGPRGGGIAFEDSPNVDPGALIRLLQTHGARYRMQGGEKLRVSKDLSDEAARFKELEFLLDALAMRHAA